MTARTFFEGKSYPYRLNSLNLFRLVLAAIVLFAHSWYIAGRGTGPQLHGENLGGWAVAGFFVLSGFLITRSRLRTSAGDYLLHRVARIYPAFLVCLIATVALFAPIAALLEHGTLDGYLSTPVTPLQYVWGNLGLAISSYDIGATLDSVPYPNAWNGSLWTLYYEFLCYLVVWVAGAFAIFRRTVFPATLIFVFSVIIWMNIDLAGRLGLDPSFGLFFKLLPFFMGGACAYFVIDRFGLNRWIGIGSLLVAALLIAFVPGWGGQASSPFLAYGLLFLATLIPQPEWIAHNDISYGFYIYAWPMQQLVALAGGLQWGMLVYILITVVGTIILAALSWFFVERPCMRRVRGRSAASKHAVNART
ncbi:acyltransferase [Microbacterium sp. CH12i]|uniref:acyltransferase family protein n=1 Tax=Microbacterium sp. CH12i TaxID=1479651 RepID=UPI0004617357|nr:acyltransferase [Microbacterium sp. CH12i]KDA06612.1 acyltransferase [Microbacterium sp. CH12i]